MYRRIFWNIKAVLKKHYFVDDLFFGNNKEVFTEPFIDTSILLSINSRDVEEDFISIGSFVWKFIFLYQKLSIINICQNYFFN